MDATPAACPTCKAALPDTGQFASWCPACDWNVEAEETFIEWKETALDKLIERVRARYAAKQYQELVEREPHSLRARWSAAKVVTYTIAAFVNVLPFALASFAAWLIYANWPSIAAIIWGGLLIFAAWAFLPGRSRMPKNLLNRSSAPHLYGLVDKVAAEVHVRKVHALVVDASWGASFQRAGFPRKPVVTIGLPFWSILSPLERIALLAHEFAHGRKSDSLTHGFVARAIHTLANLSYTLAPGYDDIFAIILAPVLTVVSGFFRWSAFLMVLLLWQRSQEAEFRADYSAALVGGSDAARSLLRKTGKGSYIKPALDPISYSIDWRGQNFFPAFKAFIANLPPIEVERARRAPARETFAKHTTHPPDWARLEFLQRHSSSPSLVADPAEMALIDKELENSNQLSRASCWLFIIRTTEPDRPPRMRPRPNLLPRPGEGVRGADG